jgi:hypothetical protein
MSKISEMNPMGGPPVSELPKLIALEMAQKEAERGRELIEEAMRQAGLRVPIREVGDWGAPRTDEGGGYYFPQPYWTPPQWTYTTGTGGAPIYGTLPPTTYNTHGTATGYGDVPLVYGGTTTVTRTFTAPDLAHTIGGEEVTYLYRRPYPVQTDGG